MNENFIKYFTKKTKSIYQASKQTGIPYTTLSELVNKKTDINKCSAVTVFKLSLYFECSVEDLLNPEPLIVNMSGIYRNIKYKWETEENSQLAYLHIWDNNKEKIIDNGKFHIAKFYLANGIMTEAIIDAYLVEKEAKEMFYD